jgi:hypothetical protein
MEYTSGTSSSSVNVSLTLASGDLETEGDILVDSYHTSSCPVVGPFLASFTYPINRLSLKITTARFEGLTMGYPLNTCHTSPSCWNTSTPACGSGGIDILSYGANCASCYKLGYIVQQGPAPGIYSCSIGLALPFLTCPGYCSPA